MNNILAVAATIALIIAIALTIIAVNLAPVAILAAMVMFGAAGMLAMPVLFAEDDAPVAAA